MLEDANHSKLTNLVDRAGMIRDLCKHPGFKIFREALDEKLKQYHKQWLSASDEEAVKLRHRTQGLQVAIDELKGFLLSGEVARRTLEDNK